MTAPIANLMVKIGSDVTGIVDGGKKSQSSLKGISDQAKKTAAAIAAVGAAGVAAMSALTIRQMQVIDETAKMARALGVVTQNYQALGLVAGEAGVEQSKLSNLFSRGQRAAVEASQGLMTYKRAFDTIGLNAEDLIRMAPDQQFERIATALSEMENPTVRNATAMQIFGRSGLDVINMLEGFSDKLAEAREFNDRFNISVSDIDARKVEEANDTFARLGRAIGGLGNTMAIQVAPLVTEVSNRLLAAGVDGETFGRAVAGGMNVAAGAVDVVRMSINGMQMTYHAAILSISDLTAQVSLVLYDLGETIAEHLSKIRGVSLQAEDGLLRIGLAARKMSEDASAGFDQALKDAESFKEMSEIIAEIQEEAQRRAEESAGSGSIPMGLGLFPGVGDDGDPAAQKQREQMEAKLEAFRESLRTEEESEIESHERRLEELNAYLENRLLTEQEYNALLEDEKIRHEGALSDIQKNALDARRRLEEQAFKKQINGAANFAGNMASILQSGSEEQFGIAKTLAIASALLNQQEAILGAYKWGASIGGPPFGAVAAAAAAAATVAQVSSIKGASLNSTGVAAGVGSSVPVTPVSQPQQVTQTIRLQGIEPGRNYDGRELIEAINEATRNGARIVLG